MSLARDATRFDATYNISSLEPSISISFIPSNNNDNKENNKSKSLILKKNFTLNKLDTFLRDFKKIKD